MNIPDQDRRRRHAKSHSSKATGSHEHGGARNGAIALSPSSKATGDAGDRANPSREMPKTPSHLPALRRWFGPLAPDPAWTPLAPPPLSPGHLLLLTGPSGAGKSRLLRHWTGQWTDPVIDVHDHAPEPDRPVIDCFKQAPLDRILTWLARTGLADAAIYARPARMLSVGQTDRLRWAIALERIERIGHPLPHVAENPLDGLGAEAIERACDSIPVPCPAISQSALGGEAIERAGDSIPVSCPAIFQSALGGEAIESACDRRPHPILVCDEFASTLDRVSAAALARTIRRTLWRSPTFAAIVATAHDDLEAALLPDAILRLDYTGYAPYPSPR